MLKQHPDDSNALFARVLALGLRSDYVALIDKEDFAALHYMKQGRILAQQLLKQKPDEYDALLAVGVENYLTGIKPAPVRWMLSLGGIDPNKEQGIRELEQTAAHGNLLKPFAKLLLAVAALRDKNNAEGCNLLNELAMAYPRNPLYRNGAPECRAVHEARDEEPFYSQVTSIVATESLALSPCHPDQQEGSACFPSAIDQAESTV